MTIPFYARIAGRLHARGETTAVAPPSPGDRAAAISAIERAIAARARARRRNRWLGGLASAAASSSACSYLCLPPSLNAHWKRKGPISRNCPRRAGAG